MGGTIGDEAREEIKRRNLVWFEDVLNEVREAVTLMDADARASFAIAIAERVLKVVDHSSSEITSEASGLEANELISMTVQVLQHREDVEVSMRTNLLYQRLGESECADDDRLASAMYAAKATTSGDPQSVLWATSRLLNAVFSLVSSGDLVAECAHPLVQAELSRVRLMVSVAQEQEPASPLLERLRMIS